MKAFGWWRAGAATLVLAASPALAQSHQWSNFHWNNSGTGFAVPVEYQYSDAKWNGYEQPAYAKWDSGIVQSTDFQITQVFNVDTAKCAPRAGKILICSDRYGFRRGGWLGLTTAWSDAAGHFSQVTVQFNDTFYSTPTYDSPAEREYVACHELGHSIGLDHRDVNFGNTNVGSCMDYTSDVDGGEQGPSNLNPDSIDFGVLNSINMYGSDHGDFVHSTGDTKGPPPGRGPKGLDAFQFRQIGQSPVGTPSAYPEWGAIVGYDGKGRPNEFLLKINDNLVKRTFVLWSRDARPAGSR